MGEMEYYNTVQKTSAIYKWIVNIKIGMISENKKKIQLPFDIFLLFKSSAENPY